MLFFCLQYVLQRVIWFSSGSWQLAAAARWGWLPHQAPTGLCRDVCTGRCCLGEDLAQACAESMYFSGSLCWQNNYSDQRVIYNCPPATGFLREDVGMSPAIACTHTQLHTLQSCHYAMHAEHSSDISPGVYFPRRSLIQGEERMQLQPQSAHTSCESLEASPQIATTSSWAHQDWQHG